MSATILVVDDEENSRQNIETFLTYRGFEAFGVGTLEEAKKSILRGDADIILLDVQLPDGYGPTLLEETMKMPMRPAIIMITGYGDIDMAVEAMKNGAHDFLQKPIKLAQLEKSILRAAELVALRRELNHLRLSRQDQSEFVVGKTAKMKAVVNQAQRAASTGVSVLITGETGTGKEVLANAIYRWGLNSTSKPFIAINCAAIQSTVLESELFGHEAGAYTSADKRKPGLMEVADKGILFLDEISSMPVDMQAKLLRAIDERAFRRVGGTNLIKVDVQVIAASNRDLQKMLHEGTFREDLFYRLKVVDLHLPPLSERKQDIPDLVGMFINRNNLKMGLNITDISPRAMAALKNHNWPGNIRELKNTIERAMLFCDEDKIDMEHLPLDLTQVARD
jgi:DNA-binding NtrC family response regulator